jgi:HEAT repeat protein
MPTDTGLIHRFQSAETNMSNDIDNLIRDLGDREPNVRWAAAVFLGMIGDARSLDALRGALGDSVVHVRVNVVEALGKLGPPAVDALCEALGDNSTSVTRNAVYALVKIGEPAVDPLLKAFNDANILVRQLAAIALGKIGDARAVVPLSIALGDENEYVRANARDSLEKFGDRDALVRKILLSAAMSLQARETALNSLRTARYYPNGRQYRRRTSDAYRYCEQMKDDADVQVREAAEKMLRILSGETLLRPSESTGHDLLVPTPADEHASPGDGLLRSAEAPVSPEPRKPSLLRRLRP